MIIYSAFYQGYAGVVGAAVSVFALCSSDIFSGLSCVIHGGFRSVTGLFYSKRLPEGLACFIRAFLSVAYSAREAFTCLDAAVRALWRLYISGDKLLEWTTSSEQNNEKPQLFSCIPALISAAVLIAFGLPIHRMAGLLILADIPLTVFGPSPLNPEKKEISSSQREYLRSVAASMWEYFEDLCGENNNFLPPDNIQFAPHRAVAERTSPTNIGLMLACVLAARDFGFITSEEMCRRINLTLDSIDKLEKYKGNLLNWYSTSTLATLPPRFVSSVDSGNFLCCLTAVKEGVKEYIRECTELENTVKRLENIISSTDISVMFNNRRKLFCIGINPDSGEKTESCYDLYMSEMRMTSYFAVARKSVPKSHWNSLDRPVIRSGRYSGLASWTGTMFEYFMADIFIPAPYGSMSDEALRFCLQSQRKKAGRNPFGMSESGFYAFDGGLNYQYKAHGVRKLAFKRDTDGENVISPYSTFLTLNTAPRLSLENLKRLEKLGMKGKYGFFEAIDLNGRSRKNYSLVNSFMVHHVGMSLLSVDNLLNGKCMQNRFMNDGYMCGAKTLLEEKPASGKEIFRDVVSDSVIPPLRERVRTKKGMWSSVSDGSEKYCVLSNGRMTAFVNNRGLLTVMFDGEKAWSTELSESVLCEEYFFINENSEMRISDTAAEYRTRYDKLTLFTRICMPENRNCVAVKYVIESKITVTGKIKIKGIDGKGDYFTSCGFIETEAKRNKNFLEADIGISEGKSKELLFVYATEASEEEAADLLEVMKTEKDDFKKAKNPFGTDSFIGALSEKYLPAMINRKQTEDLYLVEDTIVSGNYPVITVRINSRSNLESVRKYIVFNKVLRNCGVKNTLIICNNTPKEEKTSALQTIETFLNEERCNLMLGIGGGIYVFDEEKYDKKARDTLVKKSQVYEEL